jgi:hypothetical protein
MDSVSETTESFTANAAQILRRLLGSETRLRVSPACREYNNAALRSQPRLEGSKCRGVEGRCRRASRAAIAFPDRRLGISRDRPASHKKASQHLFHCRLHLRGLNMQYLSRHYTTRLALRKQRPGTVFKRSRMLCTITWSVNGVLCANHEPPTPMTSPIIPHPIPTVSGRRPFVRNGPSSLEEAEGRPC